MLKPLNSRIYRDKIHILFFRFSSPRKQLLILDLQLWMTKIDEFGWTNKQQTAQNTVTLNGDCNNKHLHQHEFGQYHTSNIQMQFY
uniref:Uncharacterized protein n=1 Tax=Arundo donax TaxID=35708 RepID=A0A0A9D0P3_ARUDO